VLESDLLEFAEAERVAALGGLDSRVQSSLGQFFTPSGAARLIASLVHLPEVGTLSVLDPGAGTGMLSAALVERVLNERPHLTVELVAVERDPSLIPHLKATLAACEQAGNGQVRTEVIEADFILDSVGVAATIELDGQFDLVIQNPPYGKLGVSSMHRRAMRAAGVDASNLYSAFVALSVIALRDGGQIVAITPRSFFNGPYFLAFREFLLKSISFDRIHVFDSRSSVFADTGVLQENIIFSGVRGAVRDCVNLTASRDHKDDVVSRAVPYDEVVYPGDQNRFIRLQTKEEDTSTAEIVLSQPCSVKDLGIEASTGRVVDFRARHATSELEVADGLPLIYPGNIKDGGVVWPRAIRKPQWFVPTDYRDRKLLLPEGWYVVVKRFSAKEEKRRLVAAVWSPEAHPGPVAFENHLNVFHSGGCGIDRDLAYGLSKWLNSELVDDYFRTFSGHTQVNATDLRTLRYPAAESLRALGRGEATGVDSSQVVTSEAAAA